MSDTPSPNIPSQKAGGKPTSRTLNSSRQEHFRQALADELSPTSASKEIRKMQLPERIISIAEAVDEILADFDARQRARRKCRSGPRPAQQAGAGEGKPEPDKHEGNPPGEEVSQ